MLTKNKQFRKIFGPGFYFVTDLSANTAGWIFSLMAIRSLSLAEIGHFGFIVSSVTLIGLGSSAIQLSANTLQAQPQKWQANPHTLGILGKLALRVSVFISIVVFATSPYWTNFFSIPSSMSLQASLFILLAISLPLPWQRGFMLGKLQYGFAGFWVIMEILLKLFLGILAMKMSALWLFILAMGLPAWFSFLGAWPHSKAIWASTPQPLPPLNKSIWTLIFQSIWLKVGITLLFSLDLILAKHFLDANEAGSYVLLSMVGKIMFFIVHSGGAILVPLLASNPKPKKQYLILSLALGFTLISQLLILYILIVYPQYSLALLYGPRYLLITTFIPLYGLCAIGLSLMMILSLYFLLEKQNWFSLLMAFHVGCLILFLNFFHGSIAQIVMVMATNTAFMYLNLLIILVLRHNTRFHISSPQSLYLFIKAKIIPSK